MNGKEEIENQITPSESHSHFEISTGTVTAKDISSFLRAMAHVLENPAIGNPSLALDLAGLAKVFERYGTQQAKQVISGLTFKVVRPVVARRRVSSTFQDLHMSSLDLNKIREMLQSDELTKGDIIRLGTERFRISKSRLLRQSKKVAINTIESAVKNEEAIDIISQEARREGNRRIS